MSVADSEESTPPCTRLCMDHGIRFDLEIGVSAETRIQLLMQQDNQDCADHTLSIYGDLSSGSPGRCYRLGFGADQLQRLLHLY